VFGWDPEPGLIAFALGTHGMGMRVWRRVGATVESRVEPFTPFLLAAREDLARTPGVIEVTRLAGPGELAWRAHFASWPDALAARDWCRARTAGEAENADTLWYFVADAVEQYLLSSGRGSFGGVPFEALRRLALDIEVITTEGHEFPSAAREGDRIVAVALADSGGFRHVIRGDRLDERALLEECTRLVHERDPDVIEGHNIFRFDLEYLELRARRHGVTLAWGRDGSALRGRPSRLSIAERAIGYRRYEVAGRHIVDTWMLAQLHDVGARDFPSFGLKDVARHLGVAPAGRTYVDGAQITREFHESPDRLMAYAGDDALETLEVAARLAPPYFVQATLVPFDYQSTIVRGTATKIDALLLREYLRQGCAVPLPRPAAGAEVGGGHTAIYRQGVAAPVLHADVTSLYPSLMLNRSITPSRDALGIFPAILGALREYRVKAKHGARESVEPSERAYLGALQACFKLLINSFYGYLAFNRGHWNDYEAANRVTAEGRAVVLGLIERLEAMGAVPVEADTDGVYFVPPPGHEPANDEALLQRLAADLAPAIQLELDGRYAAMFSYRMKTYALLDEAGRVRPRGSAFRSRALEPFQRALITEIVQLLLARRGAEVRSVVDRWLEAFAAHQVPVTAFARTETLQDTPEVYRDKVRAGLRAPSAAYELAEASGRSWQPGDQITYYVAGRGLRAAVNERARLARHWDPGHPDENVEHYQGKVLEVWERFRKFADSDELVPYRDEPASPDQLTLF
jgi:DNA polymerase, archaea type